MKTKFVLLSYNNFGIDFSPFSLTIGLALHRDISKEKKFYLILNVWPIAIWYGR